VKGLGLLFKVIGLRYAAGALLNAQCLLAPSGVPAARTVLRSSIGASTRESTLAALAAFLLQ
jgi:hypothetical protein